MLSHRQRKGLLVAAAALALLLVLYAAFGYLLAPSLLRNALLARASEAGLELRTGRIATDPFRLVLDAYDVQVFAGKQRLLEARRASVDLTWASLWRRAWVVERVALQAPVLYGFAPQKKQAAAGAPSVVVRDIAISEGRLRLAGVPHLDAVQLSAHDDAFSASARPASGGSLRTQGELALAPFAVSGKLQVSDASLAEAWRYLPEAAGKAPAGTLGGALHYRYADGRLALSQASARAQLASGGSLRLSGELGLPPFSADLQLDAQALPLALARPFLAGRTELEPAAGTLSAQGRLRFGKQPGYEGSAALREARIAGPQGELLAWQALETGRLRLEFSPFALHAGEVLARAPRARVAIAPGGELNLARAFSGGGKAAGGAKAAGQGARLRLAIDRLRIENGRVDFSDRSLDTPFATTATQLAGAMTQLDSAAEQPARVELAGRVGRYGDARLRGAIDLAAPADRTNLVLRFRNLALAEFTPYAAKFAGYRIKSGRLSAELHYRVREGRLVGANDLVFDRLQLGEKVESASALDLPVDLAVALLTDERGRIDLAIPVSGDLRDPQIDLGGLLAKAVRNTLGKIVSAPFRMLASLFGGRDEGLDEIRFEPGSAALAPPEEETIARLAKALAERPRLALTIRGGYDPQADRRALQRAALLRELDPRDAKGVFAAERLYLARGGRTADLAAFKPRTPGYGRRLLDALAQQTGIAGDALHSLAGTRAQAVRQALAKSGIDAKRIELAGAAEAEAGDQGVPTALRLEAR